jgi:hypothetical protein
MKEDEYFIDFLKTINEYSSVYKKFEDIQKKYDFIPKIGDQKTGIIGESFIYEYLRKKYQCKLEFGDHSKKAWDISRINGTKNILTQVKTVSYYSNTKVISKIHKGIDELYIILLDKQFIPEKIWLINNDNIEFNSKESIRGINIKADNFGKKYFKAKENLTEDFKQYFKELYK